MREIYAERFGVLLEGARSRLSGSLEIPGVEAGLQTVGWLTGRAGGVAVARAAAARGVEVIPLSSCSRLGMSCEGLQLGFAAVGPAELRRGIRELAVAIESVESAIGTMPR